MTGVQTCALPISLGSLAAGALTVWLGAGTAILLLGSIGLVAAFGVVAVPAVRRLPRGTGDAQPAAPAG